MSQVKSGFRLAGLALLFLLVAGLFFVGVEIVCFPSSIDRGSLIGRHTAAGWAFLVFSISIMILEMNRWVRVLAGLLALAVLNGVLSIWSGHVLADPSQPISRLDALYLTAFFAASAGLSSTLRGRKLNAVDRISVLGFVFSFAYLLGYEGARHAGKIAPLNATDFTLMGIGLFCLFAPWAAHHLQGRRGHRHRTGGSPMLTKL